MMDGHVQVSLQVTVLVVNVVGCTLLSTLVISVALSERLHRRDPVVNNFLYTWILRSGLASFE
jgi:fluoride ion exporter CrcB/FEX